MAVPVRIQAQILQHLQILFHRLVQRRQIIAHHHGARAGHENHALGVAQIHRPPAGDHDFLPRQNEPETGDGFQDFHYGQGFVPREGRAGNRIENVDGNDVGADGLQFKRQVAAVGPGLAHADDAAGANLDAGLFQIADRLQAVVEGVGGTGLGEKTARAFEVVPVAFQSRLLEPVGDLLFFDDAQRGVRPGLAAGFQFADPVAHFVEDGPLVEAFPSGDEAHGGDAVQAGFGGGLGHRLGIHKSVFRRARLVMRRLGAEAAVLRAGTGFGVDDGAEVNLVALEALADAVRPGHQIEDVGGGFQVKEPGRLLAGDVAAAQNALAERGEFEPGICVNLCRCHG